MRRREEQSPHPLTLWNSADRGRATNGKRPPHGDQDGQAACPMLHGSGVGARGEPAPNPALGREYRRGEGDIDLLNRDRINARTVAPARVHQAHAQLVRRGLALQRCLRIVVSGLAYKLPQKAALGNAIVSFVPRKGITARDQTCCRLHQCGAGIRNLQDSGPLSALGFEGVTPNVLSMLVSVAAMVCPGGP